MEEPITIAADGGIGHAAPDDATVAGSSSAQGGPAADPPPVGDDGEPPAAGPPRSDLTGGVLRPLTGISDLVPQTVPGGPTDETAGGLDPAHGVSGRRFGDYVLIRSIARGGMGIVYQALQRKLDRTVALKMIAAETSRRMKMCAGFNRRCSRPAGLTIRGSCPSTRPA